VEEDELDRPCRKHEWRLNIRFVGECQEKRLLGRHEEDNILIDPWLFGFMYTFLL